MHGARCPIELCDVINVATEFMVSCPIEVLLGFAMLRAVAEFMLYVAWVDVAWVDARPRVRLYSVPLGCSFVLPLRP
jgi:hypothetical protein